MRIIGALMAMSCVAGAAQPPEEPSQAPAGFWDHWGDGKAEVAGYKLTIPRYGEARTGEAVLIFVTEDLSASTLVKAESKQPDSFPVIKLNDARDFTTGVYDYNVMTSAFVPLNGRTERGTPAKISFSSQEWCGHVFDQVTIKDDGLTHRWHSYFEGEGDGSTDHKIPEQAIFADALPILVRDLAGPLVADGGSRTVQVWPRAQTTRFLHNKPQFRQAVLSRDASTAEITVPAGSFEVRRTNLESDGLTAEFWVETAPPHRLISWKWSDGEEGLLVHAERLPYWSMSGPGETSYRSRLGLDGSRDENGLGKSVEKK